MQEASGSESSHLAELPRRRIGLVHAVTPAMAPIHAAFARLWPQAILQNVLDDGLTSALQEEGAETTRIRRRIRGLAQVAADGAHAVLFTCTAFDASIDAARPHSTVPLLKPNEAMYVQALAQGRRIGMIATFEPAVATMEAAMHAFAKARGVEVTLRTACAPAALAAARQGDIDRHDEIVAEMAPALKDCDVIMLAQFSTSTALDRATRRVACPVISAPDAAVRALRLQLEG